MARTEIFTGLQRAGNEDSQLEQDWSNTGEEMKFKPDLSQDTTSPENATRTSSRNERQGGRTARSGTLLNHFWQHFGKNYLNVGTFLPLLTILVEVFGAHGLYLELIASVA